LLETPEPLSDDAGRKPRNIAWLDNGPSNLTSGHDPQSYATPQGTSATFFVWRKRRLYRSIATMDNSAPLPPLRNQKPTWARAASLARDWQLDRLADRLGDLG
jgi:hypothetical protein